MITRVDLNKKKYRYIKFKKLLFFFLKKIKDTTPIASGGGPHKGIYATPFLFLIFFK
jgi:hypothetical protein